MWHPNMGTLVATKSGLVPIEDIQPGDLVWATDEETGETALKEGIQTLWCQKVIRIYN